MKLCFVASIKGKREMEGDYEEVVRVMKKFGSKVFSDHVMKHSQEDIDSLDRDKKVEFHKKVIDLIKKVDVVVAEATSPSMSVGYLISVALECSKPTVLLYKGGNEPNILTTIERSDKLLVGRYNNKGELEGILGKLLEVAGSKGDVRFNFFVSPRILSYLDWVAQKRMVPRSVFLRDLIEKEMRKDREFRQ